ncbi:MAG: dephospho-CoA kinase [Bacteroidetes bacterium]|nr:dephospho-CoA kinase [Bacteroidota bacterium]
MPRVVGITGGIGSGKTIIGRIFSGIDVPIFNADTIAKEAYKETSIIQRIAKRWPQTIDSHGHVQLGQISTIVFHNKDELKWLESVLHPFVHKRWNEFVNQNIQAPYIIRESAILIQTQLHLHCDYVILVEAPNDQRIQRVQQRSHLSLEEINQRMDNQMSQEEMSKFSHFIIHNYEPFSVIAQVLEIHEKLTKPII